MSQQVFHQALSEDFHVETPVTLWDLYALAALMGAARMDRAAMGVASWAGEVASEMLSKRKDEIG